MGADFGALLDDDDGGVRRELLEPDRRGKAGGAGADNDNVEFHCLPGRQFRCGHDLLRIPVLKDELFTNLPR